VSETNRSAFSENGIAALSYITFVPAILFLILPRFNKSSYTRFHCWQSILLDISAFTVSVILSLLAAVALQNGAYFFLGLTRVMWGVWIGLWTSTAVLALHGQRFKIPLIGPIAEKASG
jgi:uncharacterized membrane protein